MLHSHQTSRPAVRDYQLALNSVGEMRFVHKNLIIVQNSLQHPVSSIVGFGHEFLL